jgi:hypothetical protein
VSGVKKYIDLTPAPIGYAWLLLHRSNPTKCAEFFDALVNNSTDGKGDPRNTLLRRAAAAQKAREHLSRETQVQFIVRAWNAWVSGKELHVLKVRSSDAKGGSTRVSIPAVRRAA